MVDTKKVLNNYVWVFLLIIAGIGIALDLIVVKNGVGASGDAVWYMQGAENILKGFGYGILQGNNFLPTTIFPPFYSIFLAGFGWFGISIFDMAGVLNALLLGTNIFLTGWIIHRLTGSAVASILASGFSLLSFDLFVLHTWAMSEPLYITLTLISLLSILYYRKSGRMHFLILAGLMAGLSVITRYIGISLVAALCFWILIFGKETKKKRLLDSAIIGTLGLLPVAIFFIRNAGLPGTIAGRSALVFHSMPIENYVSLIQTILAWYFPGITFLQYWMIKKIEIVSLLLLSAILFYFSVRHLSSTKDDSQRLYTQFEYLVMFFLVVYGLTFMGSIYLSLAGNPTIWKATQIPRYMAPVFPCFLILALLIFQRVQQAISRTRKVYGTVIFGLPFAMLALYISNFSALYNKGIYLGYTGLRNSLPALVAELKSFDPARPLIASNYELVTFLAGRPVFSMPGEGDEMTGIANPNLPSLQAKITDLIDQGGILVVYRSSPDETFYYDSMIQKLSLLNTYGGWISISLYTKPNKGQ